MLKKPARARAMTHTRKADQTQVNAEQAGALVPGSLVLAADETGTEPVFWEARIVEIEGDHLTLVWEAYREPFRRRLSQVAMVPQEQPYS